MTDENKIIHYYTYSVTEKKIDGYTTTIEKSDDGFTFTITNKHFPGLPDTGGQGRNFIYLIAILLFLVYFIMRYKKNQRKPKETENYKKEKILKEKETNVMKRMKKIMAVLLAAIMTMAMAATAFAAETVAATTGNTLTVNVKDGQNLNGQTINLYKLFNVTESTSGDTKNYAYTVNTADGYKAALVDALTKAGKTVTINSKDEEFAAAVLELKDVDGTKIQKFANDFTTYALTNTTSKVEATTTYWKNHREQNILLNFQD